MYDIYDFLKNLLPLSAIFMFPVIFIVMPANGSHEFTVYRMQHFTFYGVTHGSHSSSFSLEARSIKTWVSSRHCVIARLKDLTSETFSEITQSAGALLIILPKEFNSLQGADLMAIVDIEQTMLSAIISIPIYFMKWQSDLHTIISNIDLSLRNDNSKDSALNAIINSMFTMGYFVSVSAPKPSPLTYSQVTILEGKLVSSLDGHKTPTIILVAHFDTAGVVPELSFGADSNGSGVAAMLEMARVLSKLYANDKTRPSYDIVFLLTGAGNINYVGSKKWIEDVAYSKEENSVFSMQNIVFAVCLDTLAKQKGIHIHVSKPPKDNTPMALFLQELNRTADDKAVLVHKKINLNDQKLAWEHERFSVRRLPAFTISSLENYKDSRRKSIFDVRGNADNKALYDNTALITESLIKFMYNYTGSSDLLTSGLIQQESLQSWLDVLAAHPRSQQLLSEKQNSLVNLLRNTLKSYLGVCNISYAVPEKSDPEFTFFDVTKAVITIYSVKHAIFDLMLTCIIAGYLALFYIGVQKFPLLYSVIIATARKDIDNKKKIY